MSRYQLAQLNIATLLAPLDSPQLQDFVDSLDRINALAEGADRSTQRRPSSHTCASTALARAHSRFAKLSPHPTHPVAHASATNLAQTTTVREAAAECG